jgi:hypothetical protein
MTKKLTHKQVSRKHKYPQSKTHKKINKQNKIMNEQKPIIIHVDGIP